MAAEAGDFDPGFSFDVGEDQAPAQAPWEFGAALGMAVKSSGKAPASTIDDKIAARLAARGARRKGAAGRKRGREADSGSEEEEEEEEDDEEGKGPPDDGSGPEGGGGGASSSDEGASSDEEDAPLPGELDESDTDGSELEGEEDEEEEEEEEDEGGNASRKPAQSVAAAAATRRAAAAAAAAAAAGAAANGKHRSSSSSSEEGDEEEEEEEEDSEEGSSGEADDGGGGGPARRQQPGSRSGRGAQQQQQQPGSKAAAAGGKGSFFAETQRGVSRKQCSVSFQDLNLSRPLLRAIEALGYSHPTPIQAACIPLALSGRDVCGSAMTGSGKTAAFALPILERLLYRPKQVAATYVLILSPTRELAAQIHSMVQKLAQFTDVDAALIVGGLSLQSQAAALRAGPAIVVATPGRVIDHVRNSQGFGLEDLAVLVLDEADRLLEMGFKEELRELLRLAPRQRQTMLFSATFNESVEALVALSLKQPVRLAADPAAAAPETLAQEIVRLKGPAGSLKEAVLMALASRSFSGGRTIIFCKTKQKAHRLKILFGLCKLPPAAELHGNMTQAARLESLEAFRRGDAAFLLATDVAARGLDILGVQVVINYDAPRTLETYLHRVGRTARAGAGGVAVTLVGDDDRALVREVVKRGRVALRQRVVPQQAVQRWQSRVEAAEPDVQRVLGEEHEEAALRRAEMEANKAANMLEHESEIFSRPARTWFQTDKQKRELAAAAAAAAEGRTVLESAGAGGAGAGGKAAKVAAKAAAKQDKRNARLKEKRAAEAAAGGKRAAAPLQVETEQFTQAIKGVKSRARALMQQQGITAKAAQRIAQKAVTGVSTKHERKKRKTGPPAGGDGGGLFSGNGTGKPDAGGASSSGGAGGGGGGKGGKGAGSRGRGTLSKAELARVKRGGKGKSSFKSKKKFKRRR